MSKKREAPPKPEELIKKLEDKFLEFKTETESKQEEQEKVNEELKTSIEEIKTNQSLLSQEIDSKLENLSERQNNELQSLRTEITEMINEKAVALEQIFNDNIAKLGEKMETIDSRNQESVNNLNLNMEERIESLRGNFVNNIQNLSGQMESESSFNENTKEQINILFSRIDDIHEKLYEFETSKKNNLIFYGISGEHRETPSELMAKITAILKKTLSLRRDIVISKAARIQTGPDVGGCRPVVVTFEEFTDREHVLRKAGMLKGSNIHVTEDMSRKVRESRQELRKYMREVKRGNPSVVCNLQYDKLYVNHRCFVWSDVQGRVVPYTPAEDGPGAGDRTMSASRSLSPLKTSPSMMFKTPSLVNISGDPEAESEKDSRIRELEETILALRSELTSIRSQPSAVNNKQQSVEDTAVENDET